MRGTNHQDLAHDFVLPTLLFCMLGAMTWAVRGCAGAGGMNAHVAPGLTWGAAWWFLARDRGYTSFSSLHQQSLSFTISSSRFTAFRLTNKTNKATRRLLEQFSRGRLIR